MADTQPKIDLPVAEATTEAQIAEQTQQKETKSVTIDDPKSEDGNDADAVAATEGDAADQLADVVKPKKGSPVKKIVASLKGLFKCLPGRREPAPKKEGTKDDEEDEAKEDAAELKKEEEECGKPELPAVAEDKKESEGAASTMTTTIISTPAAN